MDARVTISLLRRVERLPSRRAARRQQGASRSCTTRRAIGEGPARGHGVPHTEVDLLARQRRAGGVRRPASRTGTAWPVYPVFEAFDIAAARRASGPSRCATRGSCSTSTSAGSRATSASPASTRATDNDARDEDLAAASRDRAADPADARPGAAEAARRDARLLRPRRGPRRASSRRSSGASSSRAPRARSPAARAATSCWRRCRRTPWPRPRPATQPGALRRFLQLHRMRARLLARFALRARLRRADRRSAHGGRLTRAPARSHGRSGTAAPRHVLGRHRFDVRRGPRSFAPPSARGRSRGR